MIDAVLRMEATRSRQGRSRQTVSYALRAEAIAAWASARVPLAKRPSTTRVSLGLVSANVSLAGISRRQMRRPCVFPRVPLTLSTASSYAVLNSGVWPAARVAYVALGAAER